MKKVFVDIIPVLVGILLALFLNNWKQSSAERHYLENSVISIIRENNENIKELEYALERQARFMDTLRHYIEDETYKLEDVMRKSQGVYTPDLKSTTWKFLIQDSKHTLVSYEIINQLGEIEKFETLVRAYNEKIRDVMFQQAFFSDPELKRVAFILFSDFRNTEQDMIRQLQSFNQFASSEYDITDLQLSGSED